MTACIEWAAARDARGYGRRWFGGRVMWAHRAAWLEAGNEIPNGYLIHHECENRSCVNVNHLRAVSPSEHRWIHTRDVTHCKHGHEFTPENTYLMHGQNRKCRACNREARRRATEREAAKATIGTVI